MQPWMIDLEDQGTREHIPILPREGGEFLRWLVALKQPQHILEIGTAIGYSTLWLSLGMNSKGTLTTIEKDPARLAQAQQNFDRYGPYQQVQFLLGDAGEILPKLSGPYDLVFLDGPKGQYPRYLQLIETLTAPGALLVADNLFLHGLAAGKEQPIRYTTMAKRLQEYARLVQESPLWDTQFLPIGDGFALSIRKDGSP